MNFVKVSPVFSLTAQTTNDKHKQQKTTSNTQQQSTPNTKQPITNSNINKGNSSNNATVGNKFAALSCNEISRIQLLLPSSYNY